MPSAANLALLAVLFAPCLASADDAKPPSAASNVETTNVNLVPMVERVEPFHGGVIPDGAHVERRDDPARKKLAGVLFWSGYGPQLVLAAVFLLAGASLAFVNPLLSAIGFVMAPLMLIPLLSPALLLVSLLVGGTGGLFLAMFPAAAIVLEVMGIYYWLTSKQDMLVYAPQPNPAMMPPPQSLLPAPSQQLQLMALRF